MTWTHVCYHLKSFLNLVRNLQAASLSNLCKLGCQNMYPLVYVNILCFKTSYNHFRHFMPTHSPVFVVSKQGVKLGGCIWACQSQYTILDGHLLPDWSPEKKTEKNFSSSATPYTISATMLTSIKLRQRRKFLRVDVNWPAGWGLKTIRVPTALK